MGLAGLACRCVLAQSLNDGEQDQATQSFERAVHDLRTDDGAEFGNVDFR